jgi:NADH-quinone oxidoreductase subunit N
MALLVALLGLVGTPPTVVFVGKLTTATAAWDGGLQWLAIVVFGNTLISLFYYLRWLVPVFQSGQDSNGRTSRRSPARTALTASALSLLLGVGSGVLWNALA